MVITYGKLEVTNGHHKDTCHDMSGLCPHNVDIILDSVGNTLAKASVII
jgi:hypothetical protein